MFSLEMLKSIKEEIRVGCYTVDKNGVLNSELLKSRGEEWRDRMLEKKRARVGSVQLRNDKKRERTAWFMRTTWFLRDGLAQEDRDMVHS